MCKVRRTHFNACKSIRKSIIYIKKDILEVWFRKNVESLGKAPPVHFPSAITASYFAKCEYVE